MSSHMMLDEEFQAIADWLSHQANNKNSKYKYSIAEFLGVDFDEFYKMEEDKINYLIGIAVINLYNLNRLALVTRYGDEYDRNDIKEFPPSRKYSITTPKEIVRILSSLSYQSGEYIIHTTDLYKKLNILIGNICRIIVLH